MSDAPPPIDWTDVDTGNVRPLHAPRRPAGETNTPPHDTTAERAVLGAVLLQPHLIPELAGILRDDDWYSPAHETIWAAICDHHATGRPVDPVTIAAAVGTHRALAGHGGPLYISDLAADPAVLPANATWHARIIATKATQRRTAALGTWLHQASASEADPDQIRARLEAHLADRNPADRPTSSWSALDLDGALAGHDTEDRPTLMPRSDGQHLIYPGVNVLAGEPTSGKTWLALHAVTTELAAGHHVAYIDFEDRASRVVARLLTLGAHPDQIRAHFRYVRPNLAIDTTGRQALTTVVTGTTLTVLDGVTEAMTLHGLDLSSNPDVARFYALLPRWIADHGPAVILIDHVVKDSDRQGRWSIGGQHKLAGLDGASYTVKNVEPLGRGKRGHSRVFIAKDRHGHVEEHALGRCAAEFHLDSTDPNVAIARLDPPEAMPTTDAGDMRPTYLMEKVSRWLELNPGSTGRQVDEAKLGKVTYVRQALRALVAEGYADAQPGPRNATHYRSVQPFRREGEA